MGDKAVAAIGSRETVMAFMALGVRVYAADNRQEAQKALFDAAREGYAVILITEEIAQEIPEAISRYDTQPTPAIIPIPGASGSLGLGMAHVHANVEKAVGANILLNNKEG